VNWRAVRALVRRDLLVVRRSRALMIPLVIVPLILLVVAPLVITLLPAFAMKGDPASAAELEEMLRTLPPALRASFGESPTEQWLHLVHTQLLPALFLLVPFLVAQVIAADGFAGERERKTLEALLYTPLTDGELLGAKLLAALIPAIVVDVVGFIVSAATLALGTSMLFGQTLLPDLTWLVLVAWVGPAFAATGLAAMLLISLRVRGTQEAIQLGGLLVVPIVVLLISTVRGAIMLGPRTLAIGGALLWLLAIALLLGGQRAFRRSRLVTRL
jgi:ABC-type Na+ efflux pump permease subunit